ncbi:MAG: CBS domain-containing protein [Planctomycetota bacterium]
MIRYQDLRVKDVLSGPPRTYPADATLDEAEEALLLEDPSCEGVLVVDDDGNFLGSITLCDLVRARRERSARTVGGAMHRDVPTCGPDERLARACQLMIRGRSHRCVVLDGRRPLGAVTVTDAARVMACLEDLSRRGPVRHTFKPFEEPEPESEPNPGVAPC